MPIQGTQYGAGRMGGPPGRVIPNIRLRGGRRAQKAAANSNRKPWITRWGLSVGAFVALFALALPSETSNGPGVTAAALYALALTAVFQFASSFGSAPAMLLVILFGSAYGLQYGEAASQGAVLFGLSVTTDSIQSALLNLVAFLGVIVAVAPLFDRAWTRLVKPSAENEDPSRMTATAGLFILLAVSFGVALQLGTWSQYGSKAGTADAGSFRIDFFYEPSLVSAFAITIDNLLRVHDGTLPASRKKGLYAILAGLALLLFMRQVRRVMLFVLVMAALQALARPRIARGLSDRPQRTLTVGALMAAILIAFLAASSAWRASSQSLKTNDIGERLGDMGAHMEQVNGDTMSESRKRFTYLWTDAAGVQYADHFSGTLTMSKMLVGAFVGTIPGVIFPDKYMYSADACEASFERIGMRGYDLACTPVVEGLIAEGFPGILMVALAWAPILGVAASYFRRRTAFGLAMFAHLMLPLITIESSAFPIFMSIRLAGMSAAFIAICSIPRFVFPSLGPQANAPVRRFRAARTS